MEVDQGARTCYRHKDRETGLRCTRCGQSACPDCLRPAPVGSHCLQCLKDGQKSMRLIDVHRQRNSGPGVALIVTLCVAGFLLQSLDAVGSLQLPGWLDGMESRYSMVGFLVADGEWYRLVSSLFLHFGFFHLLMNMVAVWIYGLEVEREEGPIRTVALFLVAGIAGGAAAFVFHSPLAQVAGASGGVFGLLGVALVRTVRAGRPAQQLVGILVINLFIGIAVPNISLAAHGGGFAAGVLYAFGSTLPARYRPVWVSGLALVATLAVSALAVTGLEPGLLSA